MGFVAGEGCGDAAVAERQLTALPGHERFYRPETLTWHELGDGADRMAEEVARLDERGAPSRLRRTAGLLKRFVTSVRDH
jgi:hypothetical protein